MWQWLISLSLKKHKASSLWHCWCQAVFSLRYHFVLAFSFQDRKAGPTTPRAPSASQHSTIDVKHGCEDSWGLLSSTTQPGKGTLGGFSGEALMRQCCSWDRNEKWFPPLGMAVDISKHNFGIQLFAPPFQMSVLVVVTIEDGQQSAWSGQALVFPPLIGWLVVSFLP